MVNVATLPRLHYVGDNIVGVVSDCECEGKPRPLGDGVVAVPDHEHESHDIVPPRFDSDLPEGVDFEHYKAWCRMFAVAPQMLMALTVALECLTKYRARSEMANAVCETLERVIEKAKTGN